VVNTGSVLGLAAVVNTRASLDHDNELMEGAHVMPGATLAGAVIVGRYATVGSGAVVLPGVRIGDNAYVGAGAVALEDVPADTVVVGAPARFLKRQPPLPF
jgi:acetyltransferase-like isoleucine patch superfamily enzyme